ncbi:GL14461 [Drosophila persimilis]|uniref:GL14461 n=1 Tax=Drosophila persimilis TaxID=7234 RepID=B4GU15_DROPE|nr:GL14461 [Drosophila persimilis]
MECVTSITAGLTRRGCLARLHPNGYCAEPCKRCNTSLCNRHVYPTDRLRCYQCTGSDCIDVTAKPHLLLPCPVYWEGDPLLHQRCPPCPKHATAAVSTTNLRRHLFRTSASSATTTAVTAERTVTRESLPPMHPPTPVSQS